MTTSSLSKVFINAFLIITVLFSALPASKTVTMWIMPNGNYPVRDLKIYTDQFTNVVSSIREKVTDLYGDPDIENNLNMIISNGDIVSYGWTFNDGSIAEGALQERTYSRPGEYSEILKATDSKGNIDYDFTVVQVYDRDNPDQSIPTIQPAYHPTLDIKPGDPVTFLVRTFNTETGSEIWDFGDGSPTVSVKSETVDRQNVTEGKFAETVHTFAEPGDYIVKVERSDELGIKAAACLHVVVND